MSLRIVPQKSLKQLAFPKCDSFAQLFAKPLILRYLRRWDTLNSVTTVPRKSLILLADTLSKSARTVPRKSLILLANAMPRLCVYILRIYRQGLMVPCLFARVGPGPQICGDRIDRFGFRGCPPAVAHGAALGGGWAKVHEIARLPHPRASHSQISCSALDFWRR